MIARFVTDLSNVAGDAKLYRLDTPLDGVEYVTVSVQDWPRWNCVETQILPAFPGGATIPGPDGAISNLIRLPGSVKPHVSPPPHDEALASVGYTADYSPWPEPEPTFKLIRALRVLALTDPAGNVLDLAEGEEIELPIPVADNLIAQGAVVAVEGE